jgi:hypothetical protein
MPLRFHSVGILPTLCWICIGSQICTSLVGTAGWLVAPKISRAKTTAAVMQTLSTAATHTLRWPGRLQAACHGEVRVEYHRLNPGTFVRFTPQSAAFQKALDGHGVDLEALLRDTLMRHTALSEGDWIEVHVPGDESGPQRLQARCCHLFTSVSTMFQLYVTYNPATSACFLRFTEQLCRD